MSLNPCSVKVLWFLRQHFVNVRERWFKSFKMQEKSAITKCSCVKLSCSFLMQLHVSDHLRIKLKAFKFCFFNICYRLMCSRSEKTGEKSCKNNTKQNLRRLFFLIMCITQSFDMSDLLANNVVSYPSCQTLQAGREKARKSFHNLQVPDNPAGCVTIFGFQEVLEFLQMRYEWVGDIIMQQEGGGRAFFLYLIICLGNPHHSNTLCDPEGSKSVLTDPAITLWYRFTD